MIDITAFVDSVLMARSAWVICVFGSFVVLYLFYLIFYFYFDFYFCFGFGFISLLSLSFFFEEFLLAAAASCRQYSRHTLDYFKGFCG